VYHLERRLELDTLVDPELPSFTAANGIRLVNYHQVKVLLDADGWPARASEHSDQ
jgi:hypothetical protein